jgi:hypothetical protein
LAVLPLTGQPLGRAGDPFLGPGATPILRLLLQTVRMP